MTPRKPVCRICGKFAYELAEYRDMAEALQMTVDDYVIECETTIDLRTLQFLCTPCYLHQERGLKYGIPGRLGRIA